jgi:hypothetical protein
MSPRRTGDGGTRTRPGPKATADLRFRTAAALAHVEDPIEEDLSAAARWHGSLFVACDETASVERLTDAGDHWGAHRHVALGALVDLPEGPAGEMDVEGLDCDDGWLRVVGSHATKRARPKAADPQAALAERTPGSRSGAAGSSTGCAATRCSTPSSTCPPRRTASTSRGSRRAGSGSGSACAARCCAAGRSCSNWS